MKIFLLLLLTGSPQPHEPPALPDPDRPRCEDCEHPYPPPPKPTSTESSTEAVL